MTMDETSGFLAGPNDAGATEGRLESLAGIADLIGRPVETLATGLPPGDEIGDTAELIGLFQAIGSSDRRRTLLVFTRALVQH